MPTCDDDTGSHMLSIIKESLEGAGGSLLLIGLSRGACENKKHGRRYKTKPRGCLGARPRREKEW